MMGLLPHPDHFLYNMDSDGGCYQQRIQLCEFFIAAVPGKGNIFLSSVSISIQDTLQ